ncbi:MAG: hypothetical protein RLZZ516_2662 [Cyanobacteriota bacterium]|jgi:transcription initiation factor IIE alpha subunit
MAATTTATPHFVMLQLAGEHGLEGLIELIGRRDIELRDAAVVLALMLYTDTFSGRILVTSARLSKDLGMQDADVRASLSRLKRHNLLRFVKNQNTGERYFRLNPLMVRSSGKESLIAQAQLEYDQA